MGPNKHVKHDLGVDLSLLRQTADVRALTSVMYILLSYVYFTQ